MPATTGWDALDRDVLKTFRNSASQLFMAVEMHLPYQVPPMVLRDRLTVLVHDGNLAYQPGGQDMPERWNLTSAGRTRLNETATSWAAA